MLLGDMLGRVVVQKNRQELDLRVFETNSMVLHQFLPWTSLRLKGQIYDACI